jgi:hypothetical protein
LVALQERLPQVMLPANQQQQQQAAELRPARS